MTKKCVLYFMADGQTVLDKRNFESAQAYALKEKVPMAVIYCLKAWDSDFLIELEPLEVSLAKHNIPLIVLIGDAQKTRAGIIHHTQPLKVFDSNVIDESETVVKRHSHSWPGVVVPIKELIELQAAGKINC